MTTDIEAQSWNQTDVPQPKTSNRDVCRKHVQKFFITKVECGSTTAYLPCLWPAVIVIAGFIIYKLVLRFT